MAYTQTDLTNVEKAIASGTLMVTIGGKQITYRSVQQLEKALAIIRRDLNSQAAKSGGGSSDYALADFR